jgi:hypothetical protein
MFQTLENLFDEPVAPTVDRWLLENDDGGVLRMGEVGMLSGAGGAGKTTALVQLALAVATGRPWLSTLAGEGGFRTPKDGGRVLLVIGHEDRDEVKRRLHKALSLAKRAAPRLSDADIRAAADRIVVRCIRLEPEYALLSSDGGTGSVWCDIDANLSRVGPNGEGWSLVILAPLVRFANAHTETNGQDAAMFVDCIKGFTNYPGNPAVLVSHHTTKASRIAARKDDDVVERPRGVRQLIDGFRWHAVLMQRNVGTSRMATIEFFRLSGWYDPHGVPRPVRLTMGEDGSLWQATQFDEARHARAKAEARFLSEES